MMNERVDEGAMQQFDDGILRAYLDGDAVLDEALRARIATALADDGALAERLIVLRADAAAVDAAFDAFPVTEPDAAQLQRAYRRIQTRLNTEPHSGIIESIREKFATMTSEHRAARTRRLVFGGTLGAVALILLLVFAPVGNIV